MHQQTEVKDNPHQQTRLEYDTQHQHTEVQDKIHQQTRSIRQHTATTNRSTI